VREFSDNVNGETQMPESIMSRLVTRIIEDAADWDSIRGDWDGLYATSPTSSTVLDFTWLRTWWREYVEFRRDAILKIITIWRSECLIGVLPLYLDRGASRFSSRRLGFISTGEAEIEETCPDYLNLLCAAGDETACADLAWKEIHAMAWDRLELLDMPESTPLAARAQVPPNVEYVSRGICPVADLSRGFEGYLNGLSANNRQQARRLLREGEHIGARLELAGGDQLSSAFDDLIRLHRERWTAENKPGVFSAPRFRTFHQSLIEQWHGSGRAILARLILDSEAVGVLYGFVTKQKFDFYQSGIRFDTGGRLRSPGNLAHLLLMKTLSGRGVTAYDFLRGASTYKQRLANSENRLCALCRRRPTIRSLVSRSLNSCARGLRRAMRSAIRRRK
jgi:CelD/BcsL family acetyltransferase involved in cellulose biosynthesis